MRCGGSCLESRTLASQLLVWCSQSKPTSMHANRQQQVACSCLLLSLARSQGFLRCVSHSCTTRKTSRSAGFVRKPNSHASLGSAMARPETLPYLRSMLFGRNRAGAVEEPSLLAGKSDAETEQMLMASLQRHAAVCHITRTSSVNGSSAKFEAFWGQRLSKSTARGDLFLSRTHVCASQVSSMLFARLYEWN